MEYILRIFVPEQFDLMELGMSEVEDLLTQEQDIGWYLLEVEEA